MLLDVTALMASAQCHFGRAVGPGLHPYAGEVLGETHQSLKVPGKSFPICKIDTPSHCSGGPHGLGHRTECRGCTALVMGMASGHIGTFAKGALPSPGCLVIFCFTAAPGILGINR